MAGSQRGAEPVAPSRASLSSCCLCFTSRTINCPRWSALVQSPESRSSGRGRDGSFMRKCPMAERLSSSFRS